MTPDEPVLVEVTRGGHVESRHRGSLVLRGADGGLEVTAGALAAAGRPVFARSSLKPLQATAMVRHGFAGAPDALALAAGSHSGGVRHRDTARAVLIAAGLDESALQCPADLPLGHEEMLAWVATGGQATPICHNCSGKHAAMLATCVAAGWETASYLAPEHPLQRAVVDEVTRLCGEPIAASTVDGCGAPAHAVTLAGLATAFATLAGATADSDEGRVAAAMRAHPDMVGGPGRPVTELMAEIPGLLCKEGAEGVWAAALPDGRAFAAKVSDGASRALPSLLATVLRRWLPDAADGPAMRRWSAMDTLGGGRPVGAITPSTELRALLGLPAS